MFPSLKSNIRTVTVQDAPIYLSKIKEIVNNRARVLYVDIDGEITIEYIHKDVRLGLCFDNVNSSSWFLVSYCISDSDYIDVDFTDDALFNLVEKFNKLVEESGFESKVR